MTRALSNQLARLERALGLADRADLPGDGDRDGYMVDAAAARAHAEMLIVALGPRCTPERAAGIRGTLGRPHRSRRVPELLLAMVLATRAGPPTLKLARADYGLLPEGERVAGATDREG